MNVHQMSKHLPRNDAYSANIMQCQNCNGILINLSKCQFSINTSQLSYVENISSLFDKLSYIVSSSINIG
jgi:hypothetical protein